ncbi:hypothetical protein [Streptosporangium carneum]|nr:hypothetical protein [Streptosporangium carneum]
MYRKALPTAIAAVALAALAAAPASAATSAAEPKVDVVLKHISTVKESAGVWFTCPDNEVITSRKHTGDENGNTTYYCSAIYIDGQQVQHTVLGAWSGAIKESRSTYIAPINQAIVGRWHSGDENGSTKYLAGQMYWQGKPIYFADPRWTGDMKESNHSFTAPAGTVITGRRHQGDENGYTRYQYARVVFPG